MGEHQPEKGNRIFFKMESLEVSGREYAMGIEVLSGWETHVLPSIVKTKPVNNTVGM